MSRRNLKQLKSIDIKINAEQFGGGGVVRGGFTHNYALTTQPCVVFSKRGKKVEG